MTQRHWETCKDVCILVNSYMNDNNCFFFFVNICKLELNFLKLDFLLLTGLKKKLWCIEFFLCTPFYYTVSLKVPHCK